MPLKCSCCVDLAQDNQLAFYQDLNNGGWNLSLGPEYVIGSDVPLPPNIRLVETGNPRLPYNGICVKCLAQIGKVNEICGFHQHSLNFNGKKVSLVYSSRDRPATGAQKWSKVIGSFPHIRQFTATTGQSDVVLIGFDTIHFHGATDLDEIINVGNDVSRRSKLYPRNYQWRSFFFACFNNVLLCLPTGMGKTLIATMLMCAYHRRNIKKGMTFIVPTVVLVDQQATVIQRNTGLKVMRRSGEQNSKAAWSSNEICVCTPAMFLNAIKLNLVDMSQQSLLILDECHEANSPLSPYGLLLPYVLKCAASQRPRILGLSASPSNANTHDVRGTISSLCNKLLAVPYTPLVVDDDSNEMVKSIGCEFVGLSKTMFQMAYEYFVFESLERLSRCHSFFGSNWTPIPVNVPTPIKIDICVKSLSHSRQIAQSFTDQPLYELTLWMRKWIDSLDLLQIFGPRKLIEFVQADLKFVEHNKSLNKISPEIHSLVEQMRKSIDRIVSENDVADDSPKVAELLRRLKAHRTDDERILIFVNRRNTAEILCRKLKSVTDISHMNPLFIVGNSGSNFPKEMQHSILEMFSKGECRILISTSVLEQGVDVAACGLVICFDGVKSVKSTIQSRGRARKSVANFVAFVTSDEQRKANELTQMEISMDYAIRQLMVEYKSTFDPYVHLEVEKFLDSDRLMVNETEYSDTEEMDDSNEPMILDNDDDDKNVMHLRFFNFVNTKHWVESLVDHIENCSPSIEGIRVNREMIHAKVSATTTDNYSKIVKEISSLRMNRKNSRLRSWFDVSYRIPTSDDEMELKGFDVDELRGFYFEDFLTVNYDPVHIRNGTFEFTIRSNVILLSLSESQQFSIRAIDVDVVLINDTNKCFEIFLCLRIPPCYFINKELTHLDFNGASFNLSVKRNSAIDSEIAWTLRSVFQKLDIRVFNVFNLRHVVNTANYPTTTNYSNDFSTNYLIQSWQSTHAAVLPPVLPNRIASQLNSCGSIDKLELLLTNTKPIRFHKLRIDHIADVELPFPDCTGLRSTMGDYALCGRVKVTPYRFIFTGFQTVPKNRVFRYYPDPTNFLMVSFCDEYGDNPWRSENVCAWFLSVLETGIRVGRTNFTFLGCSNSQLREGHCWFSSLDRKTVYDRIGQFPDSWSAGRRLTRIALAFAASAVTVSLDHERYLKTVAPDIEVNGINFSDGIGRASRTLFTNVTKMLDISPSTSALQIRVGGVKGVVSVYDQQHEDVMFRKSMKKFESTHNILEVLNYSRPIPLCLNRHVILLLSSFGVPDKVFLEMQHEMLMKNVETMADDKAALDFVVSNSNIFDWHLFPRNQLYREPFFRQLLFSNMIDLIAGITNHSHIPVGNGRVLMGVLDETGTLEYGQVYANIVEGNNEFELAGNVVVFRNPCVLPSDVRLLKACTNENTTCRLKRLYQNCLVIPSRGPDSHARECAGGDLDGDLYYVIWEPKLIPKNLKAPGEKIVEVVTDQKQTTGSTEQTMAEFFCDYVSKNQLGIIANAHLAISDIFGMRDTRSIRLARYVAAETDAPKKGLTVGKISPQLLPTEYPDFMQKMDKPMYRSSTILGKLYRQSKPIFEIFVEKRAIVSPLSKFNFTGNDTKSIETMYETYAFEVKSLLRRFDLQCEVDLFSGTPMWRSDYMSTHKQQHQLRETLIDNVRQFWHKWQHRFEQWRTDVGNDQRKICEWYSRPKSTPWPLNSFSFLAFPFVQFNELIIKHQKSISQKISESMKRWVHLNKMEWLSQWRLRHGIGQTIMKKLEGIECHYYGSSMLGLSEEYSDIDLYTSEENFAKLRDLLKCLDENAVDLKKPHACVTLSLDSLSIDVTNFIGGVNKTYSLAAVLDDNPTYWSALRVLIEWARRVHIVKSCGSAGIMTVISFCHLFIYVATASPPQYTTDVENCAPYTLVRLGRWMESVNQPECGSLIHHFLSFVANPTNRDWLTDTVDPLTGDPLIKSDLIGELSTHAEYGLILLALYDGDVRKLFRFCTKKQLFRLDKRYIDPKNASDARKTQCLREIKAACKNNQRLLFELVERNGLCYVEVIGEHKDMKDVEKSILNINSKVANTRSRAGALRHNTFHVANSTVIIIENGNGATTEVSFVTYDGDLYTARHTGFCKSRLMIRSVQPNYDWHTTEFNRFSTQFLKQIRLFHEKRHLNVGRTRIRRFFSEMQCNIRCGNHYFFVPETFQQSFETLTVHTVEEKVAHLEEALVLEQQNNIVNDSLTLTRRYDRIIDDKKPLMLMPLQELKKRSTEEKAKNRENVTTLPNSKTDGIRHSFYPIWTLGLENARQFAAQHGFTEVLPTSDEFYTSISVFWRQRELVIKCDKNGFIVEIRHRSTRWLSATFHKSATDGCGDVRTYLECRAVLDDDESCIETVVEYMHGRSIYTESFAKQMQSIYQQANNGDISFAPRPLIPDIFQLDWQFRSMRIISPVLKFANHDNDVIWLHNIYDGIFHHQKSEFEWFPNHSEFEIRPRIDQLTDDELCKKSYIYSLKLFNYIKHLNGGGALKS